MKRCEKTTLIDAIVTVLGLKRQQSILR